MITADRTACHDLHPTRLARALVLGLALAAALGGSAEALPASYIAI